MGLFLLLFLVIILFVFVRLIVCKTALIYHLKKLKEWIEDRIHVHQSLKVPELNENDQENQFYRKVFTYLNSLSSIEDCDYTNLFSGKKPNGIVLSLDDNQVVHDTFLGARVTWTNSIDGNGGSICRKALVLKLKKKDKRRILQSYLQHILRVCEEIDVRYKEVKLYMNSQSDGRWRSVRFMHPSTMETIVMDADLKSKVKSDLESFLKSKQYYHRLGRVWRRSYLLYGASGTGKSSFIAAMAKFLSYDVYDIDISRVPDDFELKMLLLKTTAKSMIVIEDLDKYMNEKLMAVSLIGILNFMDGLLNSCCGDERMMVFTMNNKEKIDPAVLRPGRIDVHLHFPLCNFDSFKTLASSYLGLKDHKLFPQVEEIFQSGATISPAEISEIMMVNRGSPSRALRSVITALQINGDARAAAKVGRRFSDGRAAEESSDAGSVAGKDGSTIPGVKELQKFYGLLKMKSSKKVEPSDQYSGLIER